MVHPGFSFANDHLSWIGPHRQDPITLNITPDEIWTDDPRSRTAEELKSLKDLAKELGGEVYCEGEPLTDASAGASSRGKTALGLLIAVLAAPFLFLWAIIRLPWVIWQIKRGAK